MIKHLLAFNTQTELSPYLAVDLIARGHKALQRALKFKKKLCNFIEKNFVHTFE